MSDLLWIAVALEKARIFFYPSIVGGADGSELTPDEREFIRFYRQIAHKPLQLVALKQVRTAAEPARKADMERERRDLEKRRLDGE